MDTDATDHVYSNRGILESIANNHGTHFIYVGSRSKMPIYMTRHTTLPVESLFRTIPLINVLITPNLIKNLIYVRKFTHHHKCSTEFDELGFVVNDYRNKQPLI